MFVVARDDEAGVDDGVGGVVVVVFGGIEIVQAAIFFGEAAVIVEAKTGSEAEVGQDLVFVLEIEAGFLGTIVAIGVALEESGSDEAIGAIGDYQALQELGEIGKADRALVGSFVAGVELGVCEAAAERDGVLAVGPDGVGGRHEAILENAGEGALRSGAFADVGGGVENIIFVVVSGRIAVVVDDGDPGEVGRTERVDSGVSKRSAGEALNVRAKLLRSERLVDGAIDFFANETEDFDDAEIRFEELRVGDARDLAAGIEMLRESGRTGVRIGSDAGIVLIVILEGESVFGIDDPVEVGDGLMGEEVGGATVKVFSGKLTVGTKLLAEGIRYWPLGSL